MRPAAVRAIFVPKRSKRDAFSSCSSWRTWALTAGWVRKHDCAALEKLFRRTISRKVWSWSRSIEGPPRDILSLAVLNDPMYKRMVGALFLLISAARAQDGHQVLLVVNDASPVSRNIGDYYARRRGIPAANICHIRAAADEIIAREDYARQI